MTDVILSSFLSLFALFGKEEKVDEEWAKSMLLNYMRHYLGIRNTDVYIELYSDMRDAYELTDNLNSSDAVKSICSNLHTKTSAKEQSLLLLRLMEFCGGRSDISIFRTLAEVFHIPEERFKKE